MAAINLTDAIEGTITLQQALVLILAATCGDIQYATATQVATVLSAADGVTPRIVATVTDHTRDVTTLSGA